MRSAKCASTALRLILSNELHGTTYLSRSTVNIMPTALPILHFEHAVILADFGAQIKRARLCKQYTSSRLAELSGISRPTLLKVEKGDCSVTIGTYLRILIALGLEVDLTGVAKDPFRHLAPKKFGKVGQRVSRSQRWSGSVLTAAEHESLYRTETTGIAILHSKQ